MSADKPFTKENLDGYLKELAKEFRKKNGTMERYEYFRHRYGCYRQEN